MYTMMNYTYNTYQILLKNFNEDKVLFVFWIKGLSSFCLNSSQEKYFFNFCKR